jgi:hypothetical protein
MPLLKHEYPILEYETEITAILMPRVKGEINLPPKCVYGFLGDYIEKFASEHP